MISDIALARAIHVLAVTHWIGGVAAVTTIVLPHARAMPDPQRAVEAFESFEQKFAAQVRISILLAGLSGLYMLMRLNAWQMFRDLSLHLMVALWLLFALFVYVLEPNFLHRRFHDFALRNKDRAFTLAIGFHIVLLTVAAVTIAGGVLGAMGALG